MSTIDEIMSDVQSFASAWALVGGRFDDGSMHNEAEAQSAALRDMIAAAVADARRDGAEQMRRSAASLCLDMADDIGGTADDFGGTDPEEESALRATARELSSAGADIRALPLPTGPRQAVVRLTDDQIWEAVVSTAVYGAITAGRRIESAVLAANGLETK